MCEEGLPNKVESDPNYSKFLVNTSLSLLYFCQLSNLNG